MVSRQQPVIDMTSGTLKFDVGRSGGCHWPHLDQSLTAFHSALQPVSCRLIRSLNDSLSLFRSSPFVDEMEVEYPEGNL